MSRPPSLLLIAAAMLTPIVARSEPVACPQTLPVTEHAAAPPVGWSLMRPTPARLSGGGMLQGDPANEAFLAPGSLKQSRNVMTWQNAFEPGRQKWLWCDYGTSTLRIVKRMSDAATICTVTQREGLAQREIFAECK